MERYIIPAILALAFAIPTQAAGQWVKNKAHSAPALKNQRSAEKSDIRASTLDLVEKAWTYRTEANVSHTPIAWKDSVIVADWNGFAYAVDRDTGKEIWKKRIQKDVKENWPWRGFAGTGTIADGVLYEASVEGIAYAINPKNGEIFWKNDFAEDDHGGNLTQLLAYDGLLFIGVSSVEEALHAKKEGFKPNFVGRVLALDTETGDTAWELELAELPTTGAGVWSSFAIDPGFNMLYFTTSNNYVGPPNKLSDAVVAANYKSGEIAWSRQVTEHDVWTKKQPIGADYAFGAGPQLFEAEVDGRKRRLVGAGQKSGVYYVFDRITGKMIWKTVVGYGGLGGGIMAEASVGEDRIFVWSNNAYRHDEDPKKNPMTLKALDAATGENIWQNQKAAPAGTWSAGYLANDVYFLGTLAGKVHAFNTKDGEQLWTSDNHGAVSSSLLLDGNQLFWGAGVPADFGGGKGGHSLVAYGISDDKMSVVRK